MSLKLKRIAILLGVSMGSLPCVYAAGGGAHVEAGAGAAAAASRVERSAADQVTAVQQNAAQVQADAPANTGADANAQTNKSAGPSGSFKDRPVAKKFSWEGSYVGVYGGEAWGRTYFNTNAGSLSATSYFTSAANIASVSGQGTRSVYPSTPIGGAQLGTNLVSNRVVYGFVVDYGSFRFNRTKNISNVTYPTIASQYSMTTAISTSWLASLRARIGYAYSNSWPLAYLTGGLALTNMHVYNAFNDNAVSRGVGGSTNTKIKPGWIVGAGVEMPVAASWTVGGEYQFVSFGSNSANGFINCRGTCGGHTRSPFSTAANIKTSMIKIALNYKFS